MTRICIHGAAGRMGQAIIRLVAEAPDSTLVGAVDHGDSPHLGRDAGELAGAGNLGVALSPDLSAGMLGADVIIDFSLAPAFDGMLKGALRAGVPVVSGTTRLSEASESLLEEASRSIAVLWAPNMSVGVQVVAKLVRDAVAALPGYDVEVVEAHHNRKADSPSGTATYLVEAAQSVRALSPVHGREGQVGAREPDEIGVHAIRGGGVIGDHAVHLIGPHDRIEINHRAISRDLFAAGALRAARFLAAKPAGRYALADMLAKA
ncbi:MAG: 4-hydroxy-tetrahydrodipicolinate reductase [Myxococcota bacterium]